MLTVLMLFFMMSTSISSYSGTTTARIALNDAFYLPLSSKLIFFTAEAQSSQSFLDYFSFLLRGQKGKKLHPFGSILMGYTFFKIE
jgi:hypothetical protein